MPPTRRTTTLRKLGVACAVFVIAMGAAEVLLRLLPVSADGGGALAASSAVKRAEFSARYASGKPTLLTRGHVFDAQLGWTPKPGIRDFKGIGTTRVSTNSSGMRGAAEVALEPTPGVTRVVCVGDSFTFGNDTPDAKVWTQRLEDKLKDCEVLNLGVSGYGVDQAALRLESTGLEFAPDVVIWTIFQGDLERSMHAFTFAAKPLFRLQDGELVLGGVPVPGPDDLEVLVAEERVATSRSALWTWITARLETPQEAARLALNRAIVAREVRRVDEAGARLIIVALGSAKPQPFRANHLAVLAWADELGYEAVDIESVWKGLKSHPFQPSGHLTAAANDALAAELALRLKTKPQ